VIPIFVQPFSSAQDEHDGGYVVKFFLKLDFAHSDENLAIDIESRRIMSKP
jgi:hypothetical protein